MEKIDNLNSIEVLTFEELNNTNGGGFWKDVGRFLDWYQARIDHAIANGSSGMEFYGGA